MEKEKVKLLWGQGFCGIFNGTYLSYGNFNNFILHVVR